MTMRKLFRMKYESCSSKCYEYSDVMKIHTLGLDAQGAATFLRRLLAIHEPSCGNANLAFRLDADEDNGTFVASFQRYGALDLFGGKTPLEAMDKMIDGALAYFAGDEFAKNIADSPYSYLTREYVCEHGTDEKLVNFALTFSGLNEAEQAQVRAQL